MKRAFKALCIITIITMLGATIVIAGQNQAAAPASAGKSVSATTEVGSKVQSCAANDSVAGDKNIVLAANCIEKGLQCTLKGTPCCPGSDCKGKFPNTYCE
jgi:hypothetical protein